jgi:hypothetical protein
MYSTAARAKSTSTVAVEDADGEEEDVDVDNGDELAELSDDCDGEGEESKTMPLLVASAG